MNLPRAVALLVVLSTVMGCAGHDPQQSLDLAAAQFQSIKEDPQILHDAPKDVARAGEALERAQRFATYRGGADDARHYAYLSQRYSEIARQHSEQLSNREHASRLAAEHERLRQLLQEAKLHAAQQEGNWLEDQMISLAAAETDRGLVITLGDMLFESGSVRLSASANRTLLKLVHFLRLNPRRTARIEGYSDNRGDALENLALSRARAQEVARFLADLGIEAQRIEVTAFGERFPVSENASAHGRAQNRRVEIVLSDEHGTLGPGR